MAGSLFQGSKIMRTIRGMVLGGVALAMMTLVATAADKPKDLIVGKWEMVVKVKIKDETKEIKLELELTKDGKANMKTPQGTKTATYKVVDDKTMELTSKMGDKEKTDKLSYKVTKDTLEITEKGRTMKFTRVKDKKKD